MSKFFRIVNQQETKRYTTPDGEDWIEVLAELTKSDFNKLVGNAPHEERDIPGALGYADKLVDHFVVSWSMTDDMGKEVPFNIKTYKELPADAGNWISTTVINHFNQLANSETEDAAKKPTAQEE